MLLRIIKHDPDAQKISLVVLYNVWGVQFHPESILTEMGKEILKNWIEAK